VDFQIGALQHLAGSAAELAVPRLIPSLEGNTREWIEDNAGVRHMIRLLSWLPGEPLSSGSALEPSIFRSAADFQARLAQGLFYENRFTDLAQIGASCQHMNKTAQPDHQSIAETYTVNYGPLPFPLPLPPQHVLLLLCVLQLLLRHHPLRARQKHFKRSYCLVRDCLRCPVSTHLQSKLLLAKST
jgi:hypothetical protein